MNFMSIEELTDLIVRYEEGTLPEEDELRLFQYLVDTNGYLHLQGHYGRHAEQLIQEGLITPRKKDNLDGQSTTNESDGERS